MARRPRRSPNAPPQPEVLPVLDGEATQIVDAHAGDETLVVGAGAMEATQLMPSPSFEVGPVGEPSVPEALLDVPEDPDTEPGLDIEMPERCHDLPLPEPESEPAALTPVVDLPLSPALELPEARKPLPWKLILGSAAALLLGVGIWAGIGAMVATGTKTEALPASAASVPAGYQAVFAKAQAGDISAMRTLAAVYTYGLGTPANREEGLRWYHRAAEAGSKVAREELSQIESAVR